MNDENLAVLDEARERAIFDAQTKGGWVLTRADPGNYLAARDSGRSRFYEHGYDLEAVIHRVKDAPG